MRTQEIHNNYRQIQESYLMDMDMSGGLFLEYQKLEPKNLSVTVTNFGRFYKGTLNGRTISKEDLFKLLEITEYSSLRLEHYLFEFEKNNSSYKIDFSEIDVT